MIGSQKTPRLGQQSSNDNKEPEVMGWLGYRQLEVDLALAMVPERPLTTTRYRLRSALGRELRAMTCFFPKRVCRECPLVTTCPYGSLIESPTGKGSGGTHPFVLSVGQSPTRDNHLTVTVRLFGLFGQHLPYVYYSFVRAADRGISGGKGFEINRVRIDGVELSTSDDYIDVPDTELEVCLLSLDDAPERVHIDVSTHAPVRIKAQGKYLKRLTWTELWIAGSRRVRSVFEKYGRFEIGGQDRPDRLTNQRNVAGSSKVSGRGADKRIVPPAENEQAVFDWMDTRYRSRRQEKWMTLGGVVGWMTTDAWLTPQQRSILNALNVVQIGKNTTFGLGDVTVGVADFRSNPNSKSALDKEGGN